MNAEIALIKDRIFELRGVKVMLDEDLAELYEVENRALKQAVRRNKASFPDDFMFEVTQEEYDSIRKTGIGSDQEEEEPKTGKHAKYLPFVFTELGVGMLSSVLRSQRAIEVNINIMRTFVMLRNFTMDLAALWDRVLAIEEDMGIKFRDVFEALQTFHSDREASMGNAGRTIVTGFQAPTKRISKGDPEAKSALLTSPARS